MTFIFHPVNEWFQLFVTFMTLREVNASVQACAAPWGTVHSIRGWALSWSSFPNSVILWSVGKHLEKHQRKHWKHPHLGTTSAELLLIPAKVNRSDAAAWAEVERLERQILPQICSCWAGSLCQQSVASLMISKRSTTFMCWIRPRHPGQCCFQQPNKSLSLFFISPEQTLP